MEDSSKQLLTESAIYSVKTMEISGHVRVLFYVTEPAMGVVDCRYLIK